jgi:hypothetical protein
MLGVIVFSIGRKPGALVKLDRFKKLYAAATRFFATN